jgi:hypothetical protein
MNQTYMNGMQASWIHSPRIHVIMYGLLLIATPFILLRNYLVEAISLASDSSFTALGIEFKLVPTAAFLIVVLSLIAFRKRITRMILVSAGIVLFLDVLGQQVTDYYFGHNFCDLQQNWHYIAYAIFAYMIYRDLSSRGLPIYKIMLITYISAFSLSLFDESFQLFMSSRIFDVCDIGKDVWGVYMGMILVYIGGGNSRILFKDWKKIRHRKFRNYYRHPFTLLLLMAVLTFIFLNIGSILTDSEYAVLVFILTVIAFSLFFAIWHLSQFRTWKIIFLGALLFAILVQGFFFIKYRDKNIVYTQYGLVIYKGIPIPFFDVMIYQNGTFRLVDKKHFFNKRDREFLLKRKPDIILIASGAYGQGGKGFPDPRHMFLYNQWTQKATQVIIQKNLEAYQTFNRLKLQKKKVLFVIHNTC